MKLTRIRYIKIDNLLESPEYLGVDKIYKTHIHTGDKNVQLLVKDTSYTLVKVLPYKSLGEAKRISKDLLKEAGVKFLDEVRMKKTKENV